MVSSPVNPCQITRHLILILFVLRLLEQRNSGELLQPKSYLSGLAQWHQSDLPSGKLQDKRIYARLVERWRSLQPHFASLPVALELFPELPLPDRLLRSILHRFDALDRESGNQGLFTARLLGQIYETLLIDSAPASSQDSPRSSRRKSQGIYYTPEAIVQLMGQQTIDRLLESADVSDRGTAVHPLPNSLPRLLDPACGGGAFLLEAYQILLDWQLRQLVTRYPQGHEWLTRAAAHRAVADKAISGEGISGEGISREWQLSWAARRKILQHCIYGVDLDPEAVTVTQLSLWLKLLEGVSDERSIAKLPDLNANLQIGNALIEEDATACSTATATATATSIAASIAAPIATSIATAATTKSDREPHLLNWEKAFPAVMRSGGFDGVIGNPPYLDSEQMALSCPTWRTYCTARYQTAIGNWDLFCVFIEKALMLCRAGGIVSLIVPNKLASAPYAAQARSLLMRHRLLLIRDYAQVPVFAASVYPLVYVVQKELPPQEFPLQRTQVRYEVMANLAQVQRSGWLSQTAEHPDACWQLAESAVHARLMQRLQQLPTLGSIAQIYGAATVAEAYALKPWLQECDTPNQDDFRFVNSGTIDRYTLQWGKKPTRYLGQLYQYPILSGDRLAYLAARRQQQARQPKIIVAGLSQRLECVLDVEGNVLAGKSTCIISGILESIDWRYLLALLNSRLLSAYLCACAGGNQLQGSYLRIGTAQLKPLPIYLPDLTQASDRKNYTEIIDLAQLWMGDYPCGELRSNRSQNESSRSANWHPELDPQMDQRIAHLYQLTDEEVSTITQTQIQQGR